MRIVSRRLFDENEFISDIKEDTVMYICEGDQNDSILVVRCVINNLVCVVHHRRKIVLLFLLSIEGVGSSINDVLLFGHRPDYVFLVLLESRVVVLDSSVY